MPLLGSINVTAHRTQNRLRVDPVALFEASGSNLKSSVLKFQRTSPAEEHPAAK